MRTGKITIDQFDKASESVIKNGKKLGAVLFETGILTAQDLVAQVKLQVKEIVINIFSWRDGRYQFDGNPLPVSEIIPIQMSTGDLIIEGIRKLDWNRVRKFLPSIKTILRTSTDPHSSSRAFASIRTSRRSFRSSTVQKAFRKYAHCPASGTLTRSRQSTRCWLSESWKQERSRPGKKKSSPRSCAKQ